MQIKKLVLVALAAVMTVVLLGCPDKAADPKPDPAAKPAAAKPAAPGASAAPAAKAGGGW